MYSPRDLTQEEEPGLLRLHIQNQHHQKRDPVHRVRPLVPAEVVVAGVESAQ